MFSGGKELVVKLLLLWKQNVHIEYTATAVSIVKDLISLAKYCQKFGHTIQILNHYHSFL